MSTYPDAVEITDKIQEPVTEGKISDVATVDVAVTSEPDTASESTELESVDTSGELQPGEQGYYRQEKRKERSAKESEQDKSNWERFDFLDDAGQRFKISLKSIEQGISRIPTLINEVKFSILNLFIRRRSRKI